MTDNAAERVASLAADLAAGRAPDPEAAQTFAAAVGEWLSGRCRSLDVALGIGGQDGLQGARNRYRRAQRDHHLARAAAALDAAAPWRRALELAEAVQRFQSRILPAWRVQGAPPANAAHINRELWAATQYGALPTTARRLHDILAEIESE